MVLFTSGNSWSCEHICSVLGGNREGCCCFNTDLLLHIFTLRSTFVPQQPKSNTSRVPLRSPDSDSMTYQACPRGTNVCLNHIVYTLLHIVSPLLFVFLGPQLLSLFFYFLFSLSLSCLSSFHPSHFPTLSKQRVNRLELLCSVGPQTAKISSREWETHGKS